MQFYIDCKQDERKLDILERLYAYISVGQSIIFSGNRKQAKIVKKYLKDKGYEISILHGGDKYFALRHIIIDNFMKGQARILVTTNFFERCELESEVSFILNYDLPVIIDKSLDYDTYLHRIGNITHGKPGLVINFVHDEETKGMIEKISRFYKKEITLITENDFERIDEIMEKLASYYHRNEKRIRKSQTYDSKT